MEHSFSTNADDRLAFGRRVLRCTVSSSALFCAISGFVPQYASAQGLPTVNVPAAQEGGGQSSGQSQGDGDKEIVVTGIRASLQAAQEIKRQSDFLVDAVSAEDIGKFPSRNVADALQQIPGVAITRSSGGEGQTITVRGLGPQFNTVLLNGRRLATDASDRSFNFDSISSDLLGGTEVYKSTDVSLQDGGIGATVNLKTLRPLDLKNGLSAVASVRGNYDRESNRFTPDAFGFISGKFADGRIGFLLAGSYQDRKSVNQYIGTGSWRPINIGNRPADSVGFSVFADGKGNGNGTYWVPEKLSNVMISEDRKRIGFNGTLQAELSDTLTLTLDGMYTKFDVTGDGIEKASFGNASAIVPGTLLTNASNVITRYTFVNGPEYVKENYDRRNETRAFGGNLIWKPTANFTSALDISRSISQNNNGGHDKYYVIHGPDTVMTIDQSGGYDTPIGIDGAIRAYDSKIFPAGSPQLASAPAVGSIWDRNNPNGYRTWWTTLQGAQSKDTVFEARWDNKLEFDNSFLKRVRFGGAYSDQRKDLYTINSDDVGWNNYGAYGIPVPASLLYADNNLSFLNSSNTPLTNKFLNFNGDALISYLLSPAALASRDQINGFAPGTSASQILPRGYAPALQPGASYSVHERVYSAYAEATFQTNIGTMPLTAVAGLRYARTVEAADSSQQMLVDILPAPGSGGTQYNTVFGTVYAPVTQESKYSNWLPSVNAKLGITDSLVFRAAVSQSLTRPNVGQLNPVIVYPSTLRPSPQSLTASGGNANLKPYTSWNYDASLEWYFSTSGYLSASFFRKDISGLIVQSVVPYSVAIANAGGIADGNISGKTANFDLTQYVNLGRSRISGLELAARVPFTFLPSVLKNTGFTASVILPSTNAKFDRTSFNNNGSFPGISNSYFVTGFYDDGRFQALVSWSRRDTYFAGMLTATEPTFTLGSSQWDARLSYDVTKSVQVFADAFNLTNTPLRQTGRYASEFLLYQETGTRFDAGVRFKF